MAKDNDFRADAERAAPNLTHPFAACSPLCGRWTLTHACRAERCPACKVPLYAVSRRSCSDHLGIGSSVVDRFDLSHLAIINAQRAPMPPEGRVGNKRASLKLAVNYLSLC